MKMTCRHITTGCGVLNLTTGPGLIIIIIIKSKLIKICKNFRVFGVVDYGHSSLLTLLLHKGKIENRAMIIVIRGYKVIIISLPFIPSPSV